MSVARQIGIRDELIQYLMHSVEGFEHQAWARLFSITDEVYRLAVAEFLMTYEFRRLSSYDDQGMIRFKFRGIEYNMSLQQFAMISRLYDQTEVTQPAFFSGLTTAPTDVHYTEVWRGMSTSDFRRGIKASCLGTPAIHYIQRLLAYSLQGRAKNEGTIRVDIIYWLSMLIDPTINEQVAYLVADHLRGLASAPPSTTIYGCAIISRILSLLGLLTPAIQSDLLHDLSLSTIRMDVNELMRARILEISGDMYRL